MEQSFYKESIIELEAVITEIAARLNVIRKYKKINLDGQQIN